MTGVAGHGGVAAPVEHDAPPVGRRPSGMREVGKITQLSITFDHRVCDGGTAGGFLLLARREGDVCRCLARTPGEVVAPGVGSRVKLADRGGHQLQDREVGGTCVGADHAPRMTSHRQRSKDWTSQTRSTQRVSPSQASSSASASAR
ncbi:2-oxo acid dehydrogenase subunit E2 [Streptomyces sp. GESEQ-35]|uniref:2-oxo acid dehydrogenase subunit E2 n=1 Tax=Streptomyces sp. GESEQ-35 TaxID=2812657 RepID=UPI0035ABF6B7